MGLSKLHYIWGVTCRDGYHKYMAGIISQAPNYRHV